MNKRRDDFRSDRGMKGKQNSKGGNRISGKGKGEYRESLKERTVSPSKEAPVKEEIPVQEETPVIIEPVIEEEPEKEQEKIYQQLG